MIERGGKNIVIELDPVARFKYRGFVAEVSYVGKIGVNGVPCPRWVIKIIPGGDSLRVASCYTEKNSTVDWEQEFHDCVDNLLKIKGEATNVRKPQVPLW